MKHKINPTRLDNIHCQVLSKALKKTAQREAYILFFKVVYLIYLVYHEQTVYRNLLIAVRAIGVQCRSHIGLFFSSWITKKQKQLFKTSYFTTIAMFLNQTRLTKNSSLLVPKNRPVTKYEVRLRTERRGFNMFTKKWYTVFKYEI